MARRSGLGRGLGALIPNEVVGDRKSALIEIPITSIRPNSHQPRNHFDEESLSSLTASVRELGVLQPVLVRSFGAIAGVILAAIPFGLLHLSEYGNSWRHVLLITVTGIAFGCMRQLSGSTRAAAIMHAAYNFIFFATLFNQKGSLPPSW